jgi:hypothetical protein
MITASQYEEYQAKNVAFIKAMLEGVGCRPVLFLGSGISKRYIGGPSWHELLAEVAKAAGLTQEHLTYLSQKVDNDPIELGSRLADKIHEWAWTHGRNSFPAEYFAAGVDKSIFLKRLAADHLKKLAHNVATDQQSTEEIALLKKVAPHAIITTNFDSFLESQFPEFERVVGEKLYRYP